MIINKDTDRLDWIEEIGEPCIIKDSNGTYDNKQKCPVCGGSPAIQEQIIYHGRRDHKWACIRYYLRNIVCTQCKLQTGPVLYKKEYDDSDTIYPAEIITPDAKIWVAWSKLTDACHG